MVGKLLSLVFLSATIFSVEISLLIKEKSISVGKPFTVSVSVEGISENEKFDLSIQGLDELEIKNQSQSTITQIGTQNRVKKKYDLKCVSSHEGRFKIGPATLKLEGQLFKSNILEVDVLGVDFPKLELKKTKSGNPVEGEIFQIEAKFFYDNENPFHLKIPEADSFKVVKAEDAVLSKEKFGEKNVNCATWCISLKAKKHGQLKLPQFLVVEKVETGMHAHSFFNFNKIEEVETKSNQLLIDIEELPDKDVDAIGIFNKISLKLNEASAVKDDAVVLTVSIFGEDIPDNLNYSKLQLPEGFKYYASKSTTNKNQKNFEFMVQGSKIGKFKIPRQVFTYFDLNDRNCKKLTSNNLDIEIKAPEVAIKNDAPKNEAKEVASISREFKIGIKSDKKIPFRWFILILAATLFLLLMRLRTKKNSPSSGSLSSLKKGDPESLILSFNVVAAQLTKIPESKISVANLSDFLKRAGAQKSEIESFEEFYKELLAARYYLNNEKEFFVEAENWVKKIKELNG